LEGKITIVQEDPSHEKDRRDRHPPRLGKAEPTDVTSGLLAHAITWKQAKAPAGPTAKSVQREANARFFVVAWPAWEPGCFVTS
jgi:hypothetical protein